MSPNAPGRWSPYPDGKIAPDPFDPRTLYQPDYPELRSARLIPRYESKEPRR